MPAPLVSVVIPCYLTDGCQAALLKETLASVAAQTCTDYEVVLVDDGSPLRVEDVVEPDGRTAVVRQENAGPAVARNAGIARSSGNYLIFLDGDDYLLPPAIHAGLDAFEAHPEAGFVVGPREEMTFDGRPVSWMVPPPPVQTRLYLSLLSFEWYIIPPSSAMFRRQVVDEIGGFQDPWGADDLDFYLRASRSFEGWCYQLPAVTRYRRYSASSSRDGERMLRSIRSVYARQQPFVAGNREAEAASARGLRQLTDIFRDCLVENVTDHLRAGKADRALRAARLLAQESPARWKALLRIGDPMVRALAADIARVPTTGR
jgi:glycosyltransferase involved in cell wall biosynthesis